MIVNNLTCDKKKDIKYYTGESNYWFTILINLQKLFISDKLLLFISELNFNEFGLFQNCCQRFRYKEKTTQTAASNLVTAGDSHENG